MKNIIIALVLAVILAISQGAPTIPNFENFAALAGNITSQTMSEFKNFAEQFSGMFIPGK